MTHCYFSIKCPCLVQCVTAIVRKRIMTCCRFSHLPLSGVVMWKFSMFSHIRSDLRDNFIFVIKCKFKNHHHVRMEVSVLIVCVKQKNLVETQIFEYNCEKSVNAIFIRLIDMNINSLICGISGEFVTNADFSFLTKSDCIVAMHWKILNTNCFL